MERSLVRETSLSPLTCVTTDGNNLRTTEINLSEATVTTVL
jgi:hypothetical protein